MLIRGPKKKYFMGSVAPYYKTPTGGASVTITYTDTDVRTADQTIYTFTGKNIGTADASRRIVVGTGTRNGAQTVSTITVAGVSAVKQVELLNSNNSVSLWVADVPSGTTGDIVVTHSIPTLRCGIGVWAMYNSASATASQTGTSLLQANTATLTIPANGVAVGYVMSQAGTSVTWTNATERFDTAIESTLIHSGADTSSVGGGPTVITATFLGVSGYVGVYATWGP